jgi:hypothetical protein
MKRLSVIAALIIATVDGIAPAICAQVKTDDWSTVQACRVSIQLPKTLKRNRHEGIDSCVAEFEDGGMFLLLDYGTWGGAASKNARDLNFAEESFIVDGKTGVFATYIMYPVNQRKPLYIAHLYVELEAAQGPYGRPTSFMATLTGHSPKDMDIARRIFSSVRFTPQTPNRIVEPERRKRLSHHS